MNSFFKIIIIYFFISQTLFASNIDLTNEEKEWLKDNPTIKVGGTFSFKPLFVKKDNDSIDGLVPELFNHIGGLLGVKFQYVEDEWFNILNKLSQKEIHLIGAMNKKTSASNSFIHINSPFTFQTIAFARKDKNIQINNENDFKGLKVAYFNKIVYIDRYLKNRDDVTLIKTNSPFEALNLVLQNKADIMIGMNIDSYLLTENSILELEPIYILENLNSNAVISMHPHSNILLGILKKAINTLTLIEKKKMLEKWTWVIDIKKQTLTLEERNYLKNKKVLKVQNLSTFPPFNFIENGIPKGYSIDYMKLIAQELNVEVEFISGKPWREYLQMLKENKLDIIPHIAVTKERKEFVGFTNFNHIEYVSGLAVKKGDNFKSMVDLKDKVIAVANKTFLHTYLKNKFPNQSLLLTSSTSTAVQAVSEGKADAVIGSFPALQYYMQKNWLSNILVTKIDDLGLPLVTKMPMGVAKENTVLKSILEKTNRSISYNKIVRLRQKWINELDTSLLEKNNLTKEEILYLKEKKVIKMCVLPDWLPFEQIDEDGNHKGIGDDIMKIVSSYISTPIILVPTNQWSQSLQNLKDRKCDILPVAMDIPSRRDSMNFTRPYVAEPFVVATKSNELFIKDESQLSHKKIGIVSSYAFIEVMKSKNPNIEIVEVKNSKEGLEKVSSGELFGYLDTMPTIGYFIQKYGMIDLKIAGKLDYDITLSVASRNDEPLLNSIMQKSLNTINEDKVRAIVGEWIKIKVEQSFDYSKLLYIIGFFSIIIFLILYKNRSINKVNEKLNEANIKLQKEQKIINSLTLSQQSLLSLFDKGEAVLFKWKTKERIKVEFISQSIYGLIGYNQDEFMNGNITYSECIHKDDLTRVIEKNKEALTNKYMYFKHEPYRIITKEGYEKWVLDYRVAEKEGEDIVYLLGYISDITEHIKNQENISHQSKMISLGEMIGNIAHQWRQPLSLISSVATGSILQKEINQLSDESFNKNMNLINENVQYLSKTIDDFRTFVKGDRELVKFNLSEEINTFLNLIKPSVINSKIKILKECDDSIELENYPNDLIQSLINIYNNSKDALKDFPEDERLFFIKTKIVDDKVIISLKDNANGLPNIMLDKVFEPYTTTKHQSQGTGLGMNITYNFVVNGMNGQINAQNTRYTYNNKEYLGAKFIITLPKT